ncbi:MAG TPA: cytochrome c oxidase assembly protein [Bryobacteraceae bacterium]|nr:cytochrome c oxidase assembly protein [Bryobacteraceae bacterium]
MTTWDLLVSGWDWEPSVVVGCAALAIAYLLLARPRKPLQAALFLSGAALLLVDLVSPIDALGDHVLLSAHVLQHFLLALIIPPLWLLGTPRELVERALRQHWLAGVERVLARPAISWPLGVVPMIVWHIPGAFNAALATDGLHIFQHLCFLVGGTIFWWPILGPLTEHRLGLLGAIAYLFSACLSCSVLGAALIFMPLGTYPAYVQPVGQDEVARLVRMGWGLDARSDQQIGGLMMWVPGCLVYLSAILASVGRWFAAGNRDEGLAAKASAQVLHRQ